MPWRYLIFPIVILTAACGAARHLAAGQTSVEKAKSEVLPRPVEVLVEAESISGRSIAPGGVGGRQS